MTGISDAIEALTGEEAIRVLADTADYEARLPDPSQLRVIECSASRPNFCHIAPGGTKGRAEAAG